MNGGCIGCCPIEILAACFSVLPSLLSTSQPLQVAVPAPAETNAKAKPECRAGLWSVHHGDRAVILTGTSSVQVLERVGDVFCNFLM